MSKQTTEATGNTLTFFVNGEPCQAFEGETVATALFKQGMLSFNRNRFQQLKAPLCNMGTCYECLVGVQTDSCQTVRRVRACMTDVTSMMQVTCGPDFSNQPDVAGEKS